jgi:Domain of unknown function (DUF4347)/Putative Ig domain/Bacterial Ig domain
MKKTRKNTQNSFFGSVISDFLKPSPAKKQRSYSAKDLLLGTTLSNSANELWALEPRMVFDGAAVATHEAVIASIDAAHSMPVVDASIKAVDATPHVDAAKDIAPIIAAPVIVDAPKDAGLIKSSILTLRPDVAVDAKPLTEIVFIDGSLENVNKLVDDVTKQLGDNAKVIVLDSTKDGVDQIAATLASNKGVSTVQILSHGSAGNLYLGTADVNAQSMDTAYAVDLALIKQSLGPNGQILIYGCDFAKGAEGDAAAHKLAELTGASVAASTDLTGSAERGGNWVLEDQIGTITVSAIHLENYDGVLAKSNTGAFTVAGNVASNTTGGVTTTITFTNAAGATGTQPGTFTAPTAGTLANIAGIYDNGAQNGAAITSVFNSTGGTEAGTVTITFSKPINNPEISLDRLGGTSSAGTSNSSLWTLTSGQTLSLVLGTSSLIVTPTTFERQVNVPTAGGATSTNSATGTAGGTIKVNGNNITTITFQVKMDQANTNTIGDGFGLAATFDAPPIAANDTFTTAHDVPVTISVLANDTDITSDALTVKNVNGTAITAGGASVAVTGGSVALNASGQLIFTPTANTTSTPSFTYTISDANGGLSTATVSGTVTDASPTLDMDGVAAGTGYAVSYSEKGAALSIAQSAGAVIADIDNANLASANVVLTNKLAGDQLFIGGTLVTNGSTGTINGLSYTVTDASGQETIVFTGVATKAVYQTTLSGITYSNVNFNPATTARVINVKVNDGFVDSNIATSTISVVALPPAIATALPNKIVNDGQAGISIATAAGFSDPSGAPLTYSATGLPLGLTINALTGVISGTIDHDASLNAPVKTGAGATLDGKYTVAVTITDSAGRTAVQSFTLDSLNQAPVIGVNTPAQTALDGAVIAGLNVATAFSDPNSDPMTFTATGLPAGLTINAAGVISGTIDRSASVNAPGGIYTVSVTATDDKGATKVETFTYTITNPAPIPVGGIFARTSTDGQTTTYNVPGFFSDPDGDPLTFTATGLPPGLAINLTTGLISGTLSNSASQGGVGGFYAVSVTANDGQGGTLTRNFNWTVTNPAPVPVGTIATQNVTDGNAASIAVAASFKDGGFDTDVLTYSATGLPAGLTINTITGVISGTMANNASTLGSFSVVVTANDGQGGTTTQAFQIVSTNQAPTTVPANITPDKVATDGSVANFSVANAFKDTNNDTLAFSATGLPTGLTLDSVTGVISGNIASNASQSNTVGQPVGTYVVVVTASDGKGGTVTETFKYVVSNPAPVVVVAIPAKSTTDGSSVSLSVAANFKDGGSDTDTLTYSATGLPVGLTINATTGVISGTVGSNASQGGVGGVYSVSVTANDGQGGTISSTFNYTITNIAPVVTAPIADQLGNDGNAFALNVASNFKDGGADSDTLTYSATGLPVGLSINATTGVISGTLPSNASTLGPYTVSVTANDGQGGTVVSTFKITSANQAPTVLLATTPQIGQDGGAVTLDVAPGFKDSNGDTLTYSATGLPLGLTINAAGVISGTLNKSASQGGVGGVYSVVVTANDGKGGTVSETFSYTVTNIAPVVVTAVPTQVVSDSAAFSLNVAPNFADGGADTDALTYTATGLPAGLTMNAAGQISGTVPSNASIVGPYTVTVTANDGQGGTVTSNFVISANPLAPYVSAPTGAQVYKDGDLVTIVDTSIAFTSPSGSPFTYAATGLPAGLSIDLNTGFIFGTLDHSASQAGAGGVYSAKVIATDSFGKSVSETVTFTISNPAPVPVGTVPDQAVVDGQVVNIPLTVTAVTYTGFTAFSDVNAGAYSNQPANAFGWNTDNTNPVGKLEVGAATTYGGPASAGQLMELEGAVGDAGNIYKNFTGTVGDKLNVTFDISSRAGTAGAGHGVNVYFEGVLIDTIIPSTTFGFVTHSYDVVQTMATSRFEIRAIENDGSGELIDNLGYTQTTLVPGFKDGVNDSDTLTYTATGLPLGLMFNPTTGVISGTLDHSASQNNTVGDPKGVYTVVITADDGQGGKAVQTFKINASNAAPIVTTATLGQVAKDGDVVSVATATAFSDGAPDSDTLTYTASGLPVGLSINATTGVISGTIDHSASQVAGGVYSVTVTANDSEGGTVSEVFTYTITNPAPIVLAAISDVPAVDGFGVAVATAATFKDGAADTDVLTYSAIGLPLGLSINATTGFISGTLDKNASQAIAGGIYTIVVTASDNQGGSVNNTFRINATNSAPVLVAGSVTPAKASKDGDIITFNVASAFKDVNGDALTYSATGLPLGLSINPITGQISGTINRSASQGGVAGVYTVVVTASDGKGGTVAETFSYSVTNPPPIILFPEGAQVAKDGDLVNLNVGANFKDSVLDTDILTYTATGLPAGLTLNPITGIIGGTLSNGSSQGGVAGVYTIAVTASDSEGGTVTDTFTYTVTNPIPVVATPIANQFVSDGATFGLNVSGNFNDGNFDTDVLVYSATGMPAGLTIDPATGIISGKLPSNVSVTGPYTIVVTADDGQGGSITSTFLLTASNQPPTVVSPIIDQIGKDGDVITLPVAATFKDPNGDALAFSATGLPAGLTINPVTGIITGSIAPSASQGGAGGLYTIIVTANDGKGGMVTDTFTYKIDNPAPVVVGTLPNVAQTDGQAVNIATLSTFKDGANDTDALIFSATGLPLGLSIDAITGKITGVIDHSASQGGVGGVYLVNVSVSDGQGGTASTSFNMSVANPPPVVVSAIADQAVQDGKAFALNVAPNFKDGSVDTDSITYSATGLPAGLVIDAVTGAISGTLANNASVSGAYTVVVTASDGQGGSTTDTFLITSTNQVPVVTTPIVAQIKYDGEVANLNTSGSFSDPNGNTLTYSATGLPVGLTIDSATGIISGTIDHSASQGGTAGVYPIVVTASNGISAPVSANFSYTVTNTPPVVVTPIANQVVNDGQLFVFNVGGNFKDGGVDSDTLGFTATGLPAGLTINPVTGVISGRIETDASTKLPVTIVVTANDGQGGTVTNSFILNSNNQAPGILVPIAPQVGLDGDPVNFNISASFKDPNGDPITFSAVGLPAGLSIDAATGIITGTVNAAASQGGTSGVYSVVITATDSKGAATPQTFSWTLTNPAPLVVTPIADIHSGNSQVFNLDTSPNFKDGGFDTDTLSYSAVGLPPGFVINASTGVISGTTPAGGTAHGPYAITVTANDGQGGTTSSIFNLIPDVTPVIPTIGPVVAQVSTDGTPINLDISGSFISPNATALTFGATGLPAGLSIDPATGIITGTIGNSASQPASGHYTINLSVTDNVGATTNASFTWDVSNPAPIIATPISDNAVNDGQPVSINVSGNFKDGGADTDKLVYSAVGLPPGIVINSATGVISGKMDKNASLNGPYTVVVTANDGQGGTVDDTFIITSYNQSPALVVGKETPNQTSVDGGSVNLNVSTAFADPNGDGITYIATGLPAGLVIDANTGVISGTIDHSASQVAGGIYSITVVANDGKEGSVSQTFTYTVTNPAPVVVTPIAAQSVNDGAVFSLNVASNFIDGGNDTDKLTYLATGLPVGLSIDPVTGAITGTLPKNASTAGPYTVTVTANDGQGGTVSNVFTITSLNQAPDVVAATTNQTGIDGAPVSFDVSGAFKDTNGDALTYLATGLPLGLSIDPVTGKISGTIDHSASQVAGGVYSVTVTATDTKGATVTETFSFTVTNPAPVVDVAISDKNVKDGTPFSLNVAPNFKDGGNDTDILSYSATGLPVGLSINPTTGAITGTLPKDASSVGPYTVSVTANDGQGGTVSTTFIITSANDAPVAVVALPVQSSNDGATVNLNVGAFFTDPNGDTLTFSATGLPAGLSMNAITGVISGVINPAASVTGPYSVTVTAFDGKGGQTSQVFTYNVANSPPVVTVAIPDQSVHDGDSFSLGVADNFKDGASDKDTLTYLATGLPPGFVIDAVTGEITGVLSKLASTQSPYSVTVTADDGQGGTTTSTFLIVSANDAPVAVPSRPIGTQNSPDGAAISLNISGAFTDPNGDPLTYTATNLPAGLSINPVTGVISGTLDHLASQAGAYTVNVTASDGKGGIVAQTFTYNIGNVAPIVVAVIPDQLVKDASNINLSVVSNFKDGGADTDILTYSATGLPAGITIDPITGVISGSVPANLSSGAPLVITVTANDGQGGTVSTTFTLRGINDPPVVDAPIPLQNLTDGSGVSLNVAPAFSDPNGDAITFTATGLPVGLTINPTTGLISGNIDHSASQTGPYSVTVKATDSKGGSVNQTFAMNVSNPAPVVVVAIPAQNVHDGATFSLTTAPNFKDGGADTDTLTYSATGLPVGLSIDPITGVISGILPKNASSAGPYSVSVTANDGQGGTVSTVFVITSTNDAPSIVTALANQTATDNAPISIATAPSFADSNGDPLTYTATGLPLGLTIDLNTGVISGTIDHSASISGPYTVTVTASDGKGGLTPQTFTFGVNNIAPVVTAVVPNQNVHDGAPFSLTTAPNFKDGGVDSDTLNYSATGLPVGLSIDPVTGVISGSLPKNASSVGPYSVSVTANDGQGGTVTTIFTITSVNDAPSITTPLVNQTTNDGAPVSIATAPNFGDTNGDPLTFTATGLPAGLSIDATNGVISGTINHSASVTGPYTVTVTASDGKGGLTPQTFTFGVNNIAPVVMAVVPNQNVHDGAPFSLPVASNFKDGGTDTDTLTYSATGLPVGLTIDPATGVISGILPKNASSVGPYSVSVTANDGEGGTITTVFVIKSVNDAPSIIATLLNQTANDGVPISIATAPNFADNNGDPLTFTATGLPAGLSINPTTGVISGVVDHSASVAGPYTVTVIASDGKGGLTPQTFTFGVNNIAPVVVAVVPNQNVHDGAPFSLPVASNFKDGGVDSDTLTYIASGLPVGLSIDPTTGVISGTLPKDASTHGPYSVSITASDGQGGTVTTVFVITSTNDAPIVAVPLAVVNTNDGAPVAINTATGFSDPNGDPLVFTATGLPAGLSIDPVTGVISGVVDHSASQTGPYTITVKATDTKGVSVDQTFVVNVNNPAPVVVAAIPNQTAHDNLPFTLSVAPNFKDGGSDTDTLTYVASGLPVGLSIDPLTGVISGIMPKDASVHGPYAVSITASDGQGGTITTVFIITPLNDAPSIIASPKLVAPEGSAVNFDISTSFKDVNGDTLSYGATGLPDGLKIDAATGVITGTLDPYASYNGPYTIVILVSDDKGGITTMPITLDVTSIPHPIPLIPAAPVADLGVGVVYTPFNDPINVTREFGFPRISAGGYVVDAVESLNNLGGFTNNINAPGIIDQTVNDIGGLRNTGELAAVHGAVLSEVYSLRDYQKFTDPARAGSPDSIWSIRRPEGFTLRLDVDGSANRAAFNSGHQLVLDSLDRGRSIMVRFVAVSGTSSDSHVVSYEASLANGDPLPGYIKADTNGFMTIEKLATAGNVDLAIRVKLENGTVINWKVSVDLSTGELKYLEPKEAIKRTMFEHSESVIKFADLSLDAKPAPERMLFSAQLKAHRDAGQVETSHLAKMLANG